MKIAILSKADRFGGGASRVAEELSRLLIAHGHTAHHYFSTSRASPESHVRSLHGGIILGKFVRTTNQYIRKYGFPDLIPWELLFLWFGKIKSYDLLHFHDLSSAISPLTVRYLARRVPTVWTFHDCSPFTGGCLYPLGCERFKTRCGDCPQIDIWPIDSKFDFTGLMQDIKRNTALEDRFVAIAPSNWMATMAMSSGMFAEPPSVIPNGVDTELFKPIDKIIVRRRLGLPLDRYVILVLASNLGEERKGIRYALKALVRIKQLQPYLILIGRMEEQTKAQFDDFEYYETGYVEDERLKADLFASADLFLFSSLADNMPLSILETMAVSTPTIGFATGGVQEIIEHDQSGFLVPQKDVDGLVHGLRVGLLEKRVALWGKQARKRVEKFFSHEVFLKNHLELYDAAIRNLKT